MEYGTCSFTMINTRVVKLYNMKTLMKGFQDFRGFNILRHFTPLTTKEHNRF